MSCLDDATVLGLVEGRLAPELIAGVDEHIDSCVSCREVVTLVASSRTSSRVLARGDTIDRYVIGDLLGAGAMGRVYSAWEPELDRRVAIKVLHDQGGRERLIKEAQAMARLNHPNVVTVHEVGTADAGVFVAMELVDGETLRAWAEKPREWREVVRKLVGVARGLAAAHAAGVIHRDVKPENVIVGADDRTRLGDFGLARSGTAVAGTPAPASFALGTVSGGTAVAGTPAYMAPELLRGGAATAASDQFSLGMMAYELLAGKRPFAGATWGELVRSIEQHDVRRIPDVPGWLDEVVQRCIALDPAKRHTSMHVVADLLHQKSDQRRPVKWASVAVAAALVASGGTWLVARSFDKHLAQHDENGFGYSWGPSERADYLRLGIAPTTIASIDRWIDAWNAERAAVNSSRDSVDQVAARSRCLVQRRDDMEALLRGAKTAPSRVLDAVTALPPPSECRKADSDPLPADAERLAMAQDVIGKLPTLRAQLALGGNAQIAGDAAALVERARQSGHAPTLADALLVHAEVLRSTDKLNDAALAARDAVAAAERGHADLLRARAWLTRVAIAGDQRDLASAEDLGTIAHAAIDRIGTAHLAAQLARLRGLIAYNRGRLDEARAFLLDARKQFVALGRQTSSARDLASLEPTRSGERTLDIASVDSALGSVARAAGDLDEAEQRHRSVLALDRELRGPNHRDIARDLHNIAGVLRLRGNLDDALATYREALAVEIATQGEQSIAAALTHNSIGLVLLARAQQLGARNVERPDLASKVDHQRYFLELGNARKELELARDVFATAKHGDLAFAEHNLGLVAQAGGDHKAALAHFTTAATIYASTIGTDAVAPMRLDLDRARSEHALGDRAAARKHAALARDHAKTATLAWLVDDATAFLARIAPGARPPVIAAPATRPPMIAAPSARPHVIAAPGVSAAVEPTQPAPVPPPAPAPKPQAKPQPKKDVGVYGSAQSW
ncbi:MAG TPA: serine/threonine-protein kinase [Kofleriaceae bacterium]